ncbi:MAG: hypothetical protein J07AB43_02000 [Candidatus Nanosalina sp. J07AB43]|nr:MAG: hypothetical protein J07AB43_02000 [Candidatus Nanosalina sp. J07AB43]
MGNKKLVFFLSLIVGASALFISSALIDDSPEVQNPEPPPANNTTPEQENGDNVTGDNTSDVGQSGDEVDNTTNETNESNDTPEWMNPSDGGSDTSPSPDSTAEVNATGQTNSKAS